MLPPDPHLPLPPASLPPPSTQPPRIVYATDLETLERECSVEFVRASGPGGQHRNKTETGVRVTHAISGVVVTATERRSQAQNRSLAFERLIARLEALNFVPKPRKRTRKPKSADRNRLADKRKTGERKASRRDGKRPERGE